MAIQIVENNFEEEKIYLIGINNNGMEFARLLFQEIEQIALHPKAITLSNIRLNPAAPLDHPITLAMPVKALHQQAVIVVDDVANTGRTTYYAFKPLLDVIPKKVELAVLVDRMHKVFPVKPDYVGLSLATTLRQHIEVRLKDLPEAEWSVYLS